MSKYLLAFLLIPVLTFAQNKFPVTNVVALRNGNPMQNAWVGGLNNPVFSEIDANRDGLMDLFVYDKAGWKAMIFLNTGSAGHPSFTYAPEYDRMFPAGLRDWAVMRDYNHDGIMDIFAVNSNPGISVYKGYELANGFLGYNRSYSTLTYLSDTFRSSIWTFADNMPVIMDINGDGDLDILAPDIAGGISMDYYQNQAVELGYSGDSLNFILGNTCGDQAWGGFLEDVTDCGVTLANCKKDLPVGNGNGTVVGSRHQGGACCGFRYKNNSTVSLLLSDILCPTVKFLENSGDSSHASIVNYDSIFPRYDVSVYMPIFPCSYIVDANNDGFDDLFISPFASNANQEGQAEDIKVVWYYKNIGLDSVNKFQYQGDTMLTNGIIDVGTESHPTFFDYNNDGLMDIVLGAYGRFQSTGFPKSTLALYTNIGTNTVPKYQETSLNWNNLGTYQILGIYPAFGDLDGDGNADMLVGDLYGNISFFHNSGTTTATYPSMTNPNWFGINVGSNAAPFIYDMNGDSLNDIVIGTKNNNIMYFWNFGTKTHPLFSPDSMNASFGNIKVFDRTVVGTPPGYATPFITTENGNIVLYSGSQRGLTFKYAVNRDSLRRGTFALLDSNVLGTKPGLRSTISVADINGDGVNDYLTGNIRGGLNLYSDVNWGNVPVISSIIEPAVERGELQVFPNPAREKVVCRIVNNETTLMSVSMYDMLGETISAPITRGSDNTITFSVDGIANGIYVIQAKDNLGKMYQRKISIFK
jgi:hypothetical protein